MLQSTKPGKWLWRSSTLHLQKLRRLSYASVATTARQGSLDIRKNIHEPRFYNAVADIMDLRNTYVEDRAVMVPGPKLIELLQGLGARDEDFESLQTVSDHLGADPTLPFRESRNGRFFFDIQRRILKRLEFQPYVLSTGEAFKRHDSDQLRHFDELQDELQCNTAFQALLAFKAMMFNSVKTLPRKLLDYSSENWVCTVFNVRVITDPERQGEPALEGVHSDGVDHTMTTFLGAKNISNDSAVTYVHDLSETTGITTANIDPLKIKARHQHRRFLDTMLIADNESKHSLTPLFAQDTTRRATRDMLVIVTRKPVVKGHPSENLDSLSSHTGLPMEIPIFVP